MGPKENPTNTEPMSVETNQFLGACKGEENTYEKKLTEMMKLMTFTMEKVSDLSVDNYNLNKQNCLCWQKRIFRSSQPTKTTGIHHIQT